MGARPETSGGIRTAARSGARLSQALAREHGFTPRKSLSVRDTAHVADDSHARCPSRSAPVPIVEEKNRPENPLRSRRQVVARAQSRNQLSGIGSPSR